MIHPHPAGSREHLLVSVCGSTSTVFSPLCKLECPIHLLPDKSKFFLHLWFLQASGIPLFSCKRIRNDSVRVRIDCRFHCFLNSNLSDLLSAAVCWFGFWIVALTIQDKRLAIGLPSGDAVGIWTADCAPGSGAIWSFVIYRSRKEWCSLITPRSPPSEML